MYPVDRVVERPWGAFEIVYADVDFVTKILTVYPQSRLSLQTHEKRTEIWRPINACMAVLGNDERWLKTYRIYEIPAGMPHRLINPTLNTIQVVEVIVGEYDEEDIFRLEDDWGRE